MNELDEIFLRHRGKRVLLDANLLLLYLIGSFERQRIGIFKRTASFSTADYDTLVALLRQFRVIVTTPHILTEVNSLANSLPSHLKPLWCDHFARQTGLFLEVFQTATALMTESCFNPYGLTDAAIQSAGAEMLVLTEDFRLSGYLRSQGVSTLNFRDVAALFEQERN